MYDTQLNLNFISTMSNFFSICKFNTGNSEYCTLIMALICNYIFTFSSFIFYYPYYFLNSIGARNMPVFLTNISSLLGTVPCKAPVGAQYILAE